MALVISLDLESYWGVHDKRRPEDFPGTARLHDAVHAMLDRFRDGGVHATWATVGMLMCRDAEDWRRNSPLPEKWPAYQDGRRSSYRLASRLDATDLGDLLFAPDLVRAVRDTPGQEVASHTFSHYYCGEPGQTLDAFHADLEAAARVAESHGITLRSLVFPRNQVRPEHVAALPRHGITAYRGNPGGAVWRGLERRPHARSLRALRLLDDYLPVLPSGGPEPPRDGGVGTQDAVNVPATRFLRVTGDRRRNDLHLRRVLMGMRRAQRLDTDYHLWWHPHNVASREREGLRMIEAVLDARDRWGMESHTMAEAAVRRRAGRT